MNRAGKLGSMGVGGGALVAALYLIMPHEGEVLQTYNDPAHDDLPTACYGHTGLDIEPGQTFTQEECLELLASDLERFERHLDEMVHVPLNRYQRAALLSFLYNVGPGNFQDSTLLRKLNAGDYEGACDELPRWVYAGGKQLPGLVTRRAAEREMCLKPVAPRPPPLISLACHTEHWRAYRPCHYQPNAN